MDGNQLRMDALKGQLSVQQLDQLLDALDRQQATSEQQQRTIDRQQATSEQQQRTIEQQQATIEQLSEEVQRLKERLRA